MSASPVRSRRPIPLRRAAFVALAVAAMAATPGSATAAVSKKEATAKALAAFGVSQRTTPEVVFANPDPIAKGTEIRVGGIGSASEAGSTQDGVAFADGRRVAKAEARAWMFYDDRGPGQSFQRLGRVALVNTGNGDVTLTKEIVWPPLIGDSLPVFLRTPDVYDAQSFRVFERGVKTAKRQGIADILLSPDEIQGQAAISPLDAKSCFIQMGASIKGDYFGSDGYAPTAALVEAFGVRMSFLRKSFGTARYEAGSQGDADDWLAGKLTNCKDAFVWIGAAGYAASDGLVLGAASAAGKQLKLRQLTGYQLQQVAKKRPKARITLMIDAPNRAKFDWLTKASPNVRLLPVPAGVAPGTRASGDKLLSYTRRMLTGWVGQAKQYPTDRFESSPLCQAGMPFYFSRAVDPTSCRVPAPPAPEPGIVQPAPTPTLAIPTTDLTLGLSTSTPAPELGGIVSLTVSLTNVGPEATTNTYVKVPLPAGLTLLSPIPAGFDAATSLWNVGPVASGAVRVLQLQATATSVAASTVTAEVFSSTPPDPDSTPNNGAPGEDDQASVTITPLAADLELTATPSAGSWTSGSPREITITLTNKGPQAAITNTVQVELPAGVDYDASTLTGGSYNSGSGLWTVPSLALNQSITLKLFVNVLTTGTKIIPITLIGAGRGDPDSTPANGPGEDDNATLTIPVT